MAEKQKSPVCLDWASCIHRTKSTPSAGPKCNSPGSKEQPRRNYVQPLPPVPGNIMCFCHLGHLVVLHGIHRVSACCRRAVRWTIDLPEPGRGTERQYSACSDPGHGNEPCVEAAAPARQAQQCPVQNPPDSSWHRFKDGISLLHVVEGKRANGLWQCNNNKQTKTLGATTRLLTTPNTLSMNACDQVLQ